MNDINSMTLEQLQARAAEIDATNTDGMSADALTALAEEREAIAARLAEMRLAAHRAEQRRLNVAGNGTPGHPIPGAAHLDSRSYTKDSPEYRTAFLKMLQSTERDASDVVMSAEERAAYTMVTTDTTNHTGAVIPTTIVNRIWDLIDEQHSIMGDIDLYRDTGCVMQFAKRVSIAQGDAAGVNEDTANDDEQNVWGEVVLSGKDFSKHVNVSYAQAKMSIDAFETFITGELAQRIGAALAADVVAQIGTDFDSTNNAMNSTAVKAVSYKDVAALMALIKNADGQAVFYGRRATIYNYLVGMVDNTGRPIFQPNAQAGQEGILIGCPVKVEDAVPANVLYVGYPRQIKGNLIQDILIESDRDIKKHVITHAGYARFECGLIAPAAFAKLTVKQS